MFSPPDEYALFVAWLSAAFNRTIIVYMSEHSSGILTVHSKSMGNIVVQPETAPADLIEKSSLVVFPHRMNQRNRDAAVEWAANSQTPIFCHAADIPSLVAKGFGAYRFHKLEGFREVDFQGGSIDFFPARRTKVRNISGFGLELLEWMGFLKSPSFHFSLRPKGEQAVLFLTGEEFEMTEWQVITKMPFEKVLGLNSETQKIDWSQVSRTLGVRIEKATEANLELSPSVHQSIKSRNFELSEATGPAMSKSESEAEKTWTGSKAGAF